MPNPSNSDLVGEAKRLSAEIVQSLELIGDGDWTPQDSLAARARTLLPELAQQLEQAEQRIGGWRASMIVALVGTGRSRESAEEVVNEIADRIAALTPDEGADPGGRWQQKPEPLRWHRQTQYHDPNNRDCPFDFRRWSADAISDYCRCPLPTKERSED